jgi:hypothetical protein
MYLNLLKINLLKRFFFDKTETIKHKINLINELEKKFSQIDRYEADAKEILGGDEGSSLFLIEFLDGFKMKVCEFNFASARAKAIGARYLAGKSTDKELNIHNPGCRILRGPTNEHENR